MDFELSDIQQDLRESTRKLCQGFDSHYWRHIDGEQIFPEEFAKACAAAGIPGTMLPVELGGVGLRVTEAAIVLQEIAASDGGLDACSVVHMGMFGLNPMLVHGTEEQKRAYLPRAARGELNSCFLVTEPDAGVDTTRITTTARREGDDYVVTGRKVWISRAAQAEYGLLLCRTQPYSAVSRKTDGMTLLFIPMRVPEVIITEIPKMGRNGVSSNEVVIDGLRVPVSCRIGEEGQGFRHLLDGINPERIMIAAEAVGLGLNVVRRAAAYAQQRVVFGRPIGQNQGVQLPLADAYSQLKAAELATYEAAWRYDSGLDCGAQANMAKLRATEAAHYAVNIAFETFGGYGYAKEYDIERFYRQLPLTRVAPVTNNLTKAFIATQVLGLPKSY
ncbi:acyl-CoA dehydrogenase family protein [Dactylosporangium fulvum]|uniref:Acyl-CoA/acyl-ACP dehydrogenase n=1 Tax=Dactylosporangium fulvum TaxID=53359 RepID=A0ABY5W6G2_9ACTN|nr:acyl-CoA dehydrogenase family protein [Dactylosporangium fulvum]UWP85643.1 acyl-CoA/acyl-ACP dehydrogenase [Dactylosporangium fulvum]